MNCYILTGGRSTRMGRSKTEMFLDRVAAAAHPVFDAVIAVQRAGDNVVSIPTIFESQHEDEGPIFGVLRALEHANTRCFVLAVDYPRITEVVLRDLRDRVERSPAPIVMPVWNGIPQPLCAGYSSEVAPVIRARVHERKLDLRGLIRAVDSETFDMSVAELINVNTTADLEEAENRR